MSDSGRNSSPFANVRNSQAICSPKCSRGTGVDNRGRHSPCKGKPLREEGGTSPGQVQNEVPQSLLDFRVGPALQAWEKSPPAWSPPWELGFLPPEGSTCSRPGRTLSRLPHSDILGVKRPSGGPPSVPVCRVSAHLTLKTRGSVLRMPCRVCAPQMTGLGQEALPP